MPDYSNKLNLIKPLKTEQYNIKIHNDNVDIIDTFATNVDTNITNMNTSISNLSANMVNKDLSNLTSTGEAHFANPSLSNLNSTGENYFVNKNLSNLTSTGEAHFANPSLNNLNSTGEARFTNIYNDINSRAYLDLSNCSRPYVLETMQNGVYWVRLYSDGFCEQGGVHFSLTGTVTLTRTYKNTDYNVQATIHGSASGSDSAACPLTVNLNGSQFQLSWVGRNFDTSGKNITWRTSGYCW